MSRKSQEIAFVIIIGFSCLSLFIVTNAKSRSRLSSERPVGPVRRTSDARRLLMFLSLESFCIKTRNPARHEHD